jgi:hypothetical protein
VQRTRVPEEGFVPVWAVALRGRLGCSATDNVHVRVPQGIRALIGSLLKSGFLPPIAALGLHFDKEGVGRRCVEYRQR